MIRVKVQNMILNEQSYKEVFVECGDTLTELLISIGIHKGGEYFFVVNGAIRLKNYILMEDDKIKIFNAMIGG